MTLFQKQCVPSVVSSKDDFGCHFSLCLGAEDTFRLSASLVKRAVLMWLLSGKKGHLENHFLNHMSSLWFVSFNNLFVKLPLASSRRYPFRLRHIAHGGANWLRTAIKVQRRH